MQRKNDLLSRSGGITGAQTGRPNAPTKLSTDNTFPGFSPEMTERVTTRQKDFESEPLSLASPASPTYPLGPETVTIHPSVNLLGQRPCPHLAHPSSRGRGMGHDEHPAGAPGSARGCRVLSRGHGPSFCLASRGTLRGDPRLLG